MCVCRTWINTALALFGYAFWSMCVQRSGGAGSQSRWCLHWWTPLLAAMFVATKSPQPTTSTGEVPPSSQEKWSVGFAVGSQRALKKWTFFKMLTRIISRKSWQEKHAKQSRLSMGARLGSQWVLSGYSSGTQGTQVSRYKVLWIGKIAKHKGIGETKVLRRKKKAKVLWIYWLP